LKPFVLYIYMFSACYCHAQTAASGLYKSAEDFLGGHLSCTGNHVHIKLHDLFKKNSVEVIYHDSTRTFLKETIFGYQDKDGNRYRFFNDESYPVLNPTEKILLYKRTSGAGLRNSPVVDAYFFSKDVRSEILPLTLKNTEAEFSGDGAFESMIELYFRSDSELIAYDAIHKIYKINRLLQLSETKK
jgi:hypothetical protein